MNNGSQDIVPCHFGPNGQVGAALKDVRAIKGKLTTSFYGYDGTGYVRSNGDGIYKNLFERGDLFLTCSEKMQEDRIGLGCKREKIFVQKYGVDLQKF